MTTASKNFTLSQVGNVLTTDANGVITSMNTSTMSANLGPVGNVTITGGSNGQVLSTNGNGGLSWASPSASISPDFSASLGTNQQWAGGTWSSAILFNVVDYNTGNAYNATTGKFTAPVAGLYQVEGGLRISAVYGTNLQNIIFGIYKNNTKLRDISDQTGTMSSTATSQVTTLRLSAGDAIDWRVYTAGGPTNVLSGSVFTVRYVGTP